MKIDEYSISQLIDEITRGQIRIPAFQRGFVWGPDRVAHLMDSIYKGYPFGSFMFWSTRKELKCDRDLGPFSLPNPKEDYPVFYVLDGQQRATSIFGVFQSALPKKAGEDWLDIFFDLRASTSPQDSQFVALSADSAEPDRYFPINTIFDSVKYRKAVALHSDETIQKIDQLRDSFKDTRIPVQIIRTEDVATVAIIFERVNRQAVALDTLQLLSAWTWSEEFQLSDRFAELSAELEPFGFDGVGEDTDLLLRCCSAIMVGDASPKALMDLKGSDVRKDFDLVTNGVKGAIDYLRKEFLVERLDNLPFVTQLVPLSVFFAKKGNKERGYTEAQKANIDRWFWRSCFSKRYSQGVLRNLKSDIEQMVLLRENKSSMLGAFAADVKGSFFLENSFRVGNVNTKTFILLLARENPRSFISGQAIDLKTTLKAANRTEFHHLMPKEFLKSSGQIGKFGDSPLANLCFLSRSDNRLIGGRAPSMYLTDMPEDTEKRRAILASAVTTKTLFEDDYQKFLLERSELLAMKAQGLMA